MTDSLDLRMVRLSLFGAGISSKQGQQPYSQASLMEVVKWMHTLKLAQLTHSLRQLTDEKEQKAFKAERLPFAVFAAQCSYRNEEGIISLTGLAAFDFDHLDADRLALAREQLTADPCFETVLLFTSPRGNGLKWVTAIDLARGDYKTWYTAICNYLRHTYSLEADTATSSPVSACFLCYDPHMIIHPDVENF